MVFSLAIPAVEASHGSCPCKEPFTGYTYQEIQAKAEACHWCKKELEKEHLEQSVSKPISSSSSSTGLGEISHSRAEEIQRIQKLRKRQIIQNRLRTEIKNSKTSMNNLIGILNNNRLTEKGYRMLMQNIDAVMLKDRNADRVKLQALKRQIAQSYSNQDKRRKAKQKQVTEKLHDTLADETADQILSKENNNFVVNHIIKKIAELNKLEKISGDDLRNIKHLKESLIKAAKILLKDPHNRPYAGELILLIGSLEKLEQGKTRASLRKLVTQDKIDKQLKDTPRLLRSTIIDDYASPGKKKTIDADYKRILDLKKAELKRIKALEAAHKIYEHRAKQEIADTGGISEDTRKKRDEIFGELLRDEVILMSDYEIILSKYPKNVDAHYALSELYAFRGLKNRAQDHRDKAFSNADPMQYQIMKSQVEEKFMESLNLRKKPSPKNSRFIQNMGIHFENKYFPETVKKESYFERMKKSQVYQQGLFWLKEHTKPLQTMQREAQEKYDEKKKYLEPGVAQEEITKEALEEFGFKLVE